MNAWPHRGARWAGERSASVPQAADLWNTQATHTALEPSWYIPRHQLSTAPDLLGRD